MNDDKRVVSLSRRRLLGGLSAIGVGGAASGAGTWAYFRDTAESTGNTIETGTLDLTVSDSDEGFGDGVSGTWTISDAKPGDSVLADLTLRNDGSVSADHVEIRFSVAETGADGMADQFEVTTFIYDGIDVRANLSDANGNDIVDIGDLVVGNDAALDDLTPLRSDGDGTEALTMGFRWAHDFEFDTALSGTNDDYQGDEFDLTVTFALHQDSSQDL